MGSNPATMTTLALAPFTGGYSLFAAPTVFGIEESAKARREAQREADKQRQQFERLTGQLAAQQQETQSLSAADTARREARRRQRAQGAGGIGRQETILGGALGLAGAETGGQKTLLGT